jgi:Na+/melibiose symporter-like transporter
MIVSAFADTATGYKVMSLSFGLLFGISVLITGLFTREEINTPISSTKFSIKEMAKPLTLRPFRQYLGMFLFLQMSMAIMSGLFFFYVDFYIAKDITAAGNSSMIGLISAALMFSMQIVALPVYLKMIENKGKTYAYRFGAFLWIVSGIGLLFIPANANPIVIYILGAVMGFGISGPGLAPHTMYGDVVDAGQLKFKDRLDGQMSGFTNLINKVSQALGLALVMFIIGLAGFESQDLTMPTIVSQPDSAMLAIRIIMAATPLVFMGIGIIISYKYKINASKQKEIAEAINQDIEIQNRVLESL